MSTVMRAHGTVLEVPDQEVEMAATHDETATADDLDRCPRAHAGRGWRHAAIPSRLRGRRQRQDPKLSCGRGRGEQAS
jgi:hypothetical protein